MEEGSKNEVIARLERLERENKRLKRIGAVGLILVGALIVMAQAPARPRMIEAEQLTILYPNGQPAITLGTGKSGKDVTADATFYGPDGIGSRRIHLGVESDLAGMEISSPDQGIEIDMAATKLLPAGATGGVTIRHVTIRHDIQDMFSLHAFDTGQTTWVEQDMWNIEKGTRLSLTNSAVGAAVELYDEVNKGRDSISTLRAALGNTQIMTSRTGSVVARPLSSLVLFDKDGKVLWNAP
jgi:hypothetical protein